MARILCKYRGCTFLDGGVCSAIKIELDPDEGCLTFTQLGDPFDDDYWDDNEDLDGYDEWDDDDFEEDLYEDEDF